jgi:hypothetical protein
VTDRGRRMSGASSSRRARSRTRSPTSSAIVDGNLAGGATTWCSSSTPPTTGDAGGPGFLDGHPHVTCVVTDDDWWADKRPEQLNTRQRINANVVKALLTHGRLGRLGLPRRRRRDRADRPAVRGRVPPTARGVARAARGRLPQAVGR